jgi:enoyl-CoA hydratase
MVNQVVPEEKLDGEVMKVAKKIAKMPPFALQMTKHSINQTLDIMGQIQAFEQHFAIHQLTHSSQECEEVFGSLQERVKSKGLGKIINKKKKKQSN